ncbi:multidrug transporter [Candidatus Kaiserbacteria bacterium]|nr:multidrug transporter [Candidatus Kaiserbacteria bacterium]
MSYRYRRADDGTYCTEQYADRYPKTTVRERV